MSRAARILITGEYPPQPGGVADFTRLLAIGLARAGEDVYVVTASRGGSPADPGVSLLPVPDLGPASLCRVRSAVDVLRNRGRVLVQYVPHSFGWRGMNLPFCAWLSKLALPVDILFHEVAFPRLPEQSISHAILARAQRVMARLALAAAERVYVSTAAWTPILHELDAGTQPRWVPIPSNLPTAVDAAAVARLRDRIMPSGGQSVGHFGTYGDDITSLLRPALVQLLAGNPKRYAVLVGRGGEAFRDELSRSVPEVAAHVIATGGVDAPTAALHIAASDILIQPYPDGATTRRTTLAAGLALGAAVVTNAGPSSEALWSESRAVALAPSGVQLVSEAERLLDDERARLALRVRAAELYRARFSLERLVACLSVSDSSASTCHGADDA